MTDANTVLVVDGSSLFARSAYTSVNNFFSMLLKAVGDVNPNQMIMCFDRGYGSYSEYRRSLYPDYKTNRETKPEWYYPLQDLLVSHFKASSIKTLVSNEADDLIFTLIGQIKSWPGNESVIVSGDKDMFALIDKDTKVLWWSRSFEAREIVDATSCEDIIGCRPDQVLYYKALAGDPSDNYPGCPGIGHVWALRLISKYGTIEGIYQNLEKIPPGIRAKLTEGKELVNISLELAKFLVEINLSVNPNVYGPDCCADFADLIGGKIVNDFMLEYNTEFATNETS